MLQIDYMEIQRVVVHTIPSRSAEKGFVPPTGGEDMVLLDPSVSEVVVGRIAKALGHQSHGIQAEFVHTDPGSTFAMVCEMMDCDDSEFLKLAEQAATKLTQVQQSKLFAPAKLITMSGVITAHERPFVALIKADLEMALTEHKKGDQYVLELMKNIFMTDSQRLYKIGFVARTIAGTGKKGHVYQADRHSLHIFDHLMTGTESRKAAFYFYGEFLGADVATSDRRLTQDFYEKTVRFIKEQGFTPSKRIEVTEALRAELRSNNQTVSVATFAKMHLNSKDGAHYVKYMEKTGFPSHAVTKDTEYVKNRLKRRQKVTFTSGVQISTPADAMKELIKIKQHEDGTSTVEIKGVVESSE